MYLSHLLMSIHEDTYIQYIQTYIHVILSLDPLPEDQESMSVVSSLLSLLVNGNSKVHEKGKFRYHIVL